MRSMRDGERSRVHFWSAAGLVVAAVLKTPRAGYVAFSFSTRSGWARR